MMSSATKSIAPALMVRFQSIVTVCIIVCQVVGLWAAVDGFSSALASGRCHYHNGVGRQTIEPSSFGSKTKRRRDNNIARTKTGLQQGFSADDNYYGSFDSSYIVREFSLYEQLEDIVDLASKPLPERPDGIVAVAKFTSATNTDCRATEASYERLARDNPATIFLRCFREMEGAESLFQRAKVDVLPCFDVFYKGNRVARVDGPRYNDLETVLNQYQLLNSDLDLFSESATDAAGRPQASPWGQGGGSSSTDFSKTPRTTASFIPGYDWNKKGGFFDEWANDVQKNSEFDFEKSYEDDWMPKIDD